MVVAAPSDERELKMLLYTALQSDCPFAIRYPRGNGRGVEWREVPFEALPIGRGRTLREGNDIALLAIGKTCEMAEQAAEIAAKEGWTIAEQAAVSVIGGKADGSDDTPEVAEMIAKFESEYEERGYDIVRLPGDYMPGTKKYKDGGQPRLYACRDVPILQRLWDYVSGLVTVDNIHYVKEDIGERGLSFTLFDPAYGGEKFSPAIMGNGTRHKYILYFDSEFPYIHQNLFKIIGLFL